MLLVVGAGGGTSRVSRDVNGLSTELAAEKHITRETPIRDSRDIRLVKPRLTKSLHLICSYLSI
jgi:hypothetical protein